MAPTQSTISWDSLQNLAGLRGAIPVMVFQVRAM